MAFGEIYKYTWWGKVVTNGFGFIYQSYLSAIGGLLSVLSGRSDEYENQTGTEDILTPLEDSGLLDKASIILTPTAYSTNFINVVKPEYQVLPTELVTNGTFDTDTDWDKLAGATIDGGQANLVFDGSGNPAIKQNISISQNKTYKIVFYISRWVSGNIDVYVSSDTRTGYITLNGVGQHTIYLNIKTLGDVRFVGSGATSDFSIDNVSVKEIQEADFDFVRATTATRVNALGLIEEVAAGIPRIDYSSGSIGGSASVGQWLFEPLRTNLIRYTEDFSQTYWTKQNIIITSSQSSPDGGNNAYKIENDATAGNHVLGASATVSSGVTYCLSIFIKKGDKNIISIADGFQSNILATFDLDDLTYSLTAAATSGGIETYSNGWYRLWTTRLSNSTSLGLKVFTGSTYAGTDTSGYFYAYGAQMEAGSYPTSYYPNDGATATVTRNADVANNSGNADLFNDSEGVLYANVARLNNALIYESITVNSGSNINGFSFRINGDIWARSGSNTMIYTPKDFYYNNKLALKYKTNDFAFWVNGFEVAEDTSGTVPTGLNVLSFDGSAGAEPFYGNTKELMYFPEALTDLELETVTSWSSFELMAADLEYEV